MGKKRGEESGGNWMDTYGDMVTLLFTFFVMLYSMSSVNEDKWAMLVRAFNIHGSDVVEQIVMGLESEADGSDPFENKNDGNSVGIDEEVQEEIDELFANIQQYIQQHEMQDSIALSLGNDTEESIGQENEADKNSGLSGLNGDEAKNIYIQFKNDVLFLPDQSTIRDEAKDIIKFLGKCLSGVEKDIAMIIVKGHIAKVPDNVSAVDSRLLSTDRAATITNLLEKEYKIPSNKLYPIGLSGDYPIAPNDTEEGRKQNRRVEVVIISKNSPLAKSGELMKILGASFTTNSGNIQQIAGETPVSTDSNTPAESGNAESTVNNENTGNNPNAESSGGENPGNSVSDESTGGGNYGDSVSNESSGE